MCLFFVLLLFFPTLCNPEPFPVPQGEVSGTGGTEKCPGVAFQEFLLDQELCFKEAERDLEEVFRKLDFTNERVRRAICTDIRLKLLCVTIDGPKCYNETSIRNVQLNLAFNKFQQLFNVTEVLGKEAIDNCPSLVELEDALLVALSGSTRCSFHQYEERRINMQSCRREAQKERDRKLMLLPLVPGAREYVIAVFCEEHSVFQLCSRSFKTCLGQGNLFEFILDEQIYFGRLEASVRTSIVDPDFSFNDGCSDFRSGEAEG